ncbi:MULTISPECIES: penicillin acylase family protein [Nostoc]|uniref:Penicillin acylase family protein n=1 Tax=Nostoc paludosum FACHB-159 TaxID=2692908 RepID=A0ABR8KC29_9NOSO|nr:MULTISPECIES: penicillin acylase family protein [Nostoc]MBD2682462.1 penicillin acylase family protein [Nostoc sp. FACHB-857]MBD2737090.1 penicillin acylase family protein [Nostoc paludosum FACHB-159]
MARQDQIKSSRKLWLLERLKATVIFLLVLGLLLMGLATHIVRQSFPQESGTIQIPGLKAEVTVQRDKWGVPHIYAANSHDLFMAQGYIHAQDRFWQMDFWRHIGSGRLSEMFGSSQVETDKYLRTMGWARVAQQEIPQINAQMKAYLEAYADGVNAYLAKHQGSSLSLEYAVLKFLNPAYQPEPWQILHSLTWGKVMAYDLGRNFQSEIERAILLKTLTPAEVEELFPPYPQDLPAILPELGKKADAVREDAGTWGHGDAVKEDTESSFPASPRLPIPASSSLFSALESINQPMMALEKLIGSTGIGVGSNNWVISGKRTTTGKPILANDPHLGVQIPSIWYEVGLHCTSESTECPYNVAGFSFAGMIGVIIGHSDRIAWGVTNVQSDVMDLYIEKINPKNPNQYEVNGKWVDMELVKETIQVAGSQPIVQTVRYTRHGPILSDVSPNLQQLQSSQPLELPQNYAVALRWTALAPSKLGYAIPEINRAQNWEEFRTAAKNYDVPAQNLVYADIDGNIGYQMPGKFPIRAKGDGRYPVPGWTDEYEWQGYIDFEELPKSFNPTEGFIASANNLVSREYPYLITADWVYGYRAKQIVEMISQQTEAISLQDVQQIQGSDRNLNAQTLVPLLQSLAVDTPRLQAAQKLLQNWDLELGMTSPAAALFEVFWKHLLANTFHDQLPQRYFPDGGDRWYAVVANLVKQPNSSWWDNRNTPKVENRDQIFRESLTKAVDELERLQGKDPKNWNWGKLHTVTFRNATFGKSGVAAIEALFNRGGFATAGNGETVNANRWRADESFEVTDIPSLRMIVDLGNLDNSLGIHTPGQSGHAFHRHYKDMVNSWCRIEYHPMLWQKTNVAANTTATLKLMPKLAE